MASVGFLGFLVTAATVMTTLAVFVLLGLLVRDWVRGTLW
jgi:hypothetical protein